MLNGAIIRSAARVVSWTILTCWSIAPLGAETPRYIITTAPIRVDAGSGLCLAIDPVDPHGIWWWQPGRSGCTSRMTTEILHAIDARVSRTSSGEVDGSFRLPLHGGPGLPYFVDVDLKVRRRAMTETHTGATVTIVWKTNLNVPLIPPDL
jgi:hypothetical protein